MHMLSRENFGAFERLYAVVEGLGSTVLLFSHHHLPPWWLRKRRMAVTFYTGAHTTGNNTHKMNWLICIAAYTTATYYCYRCVG